MVVVLSPPAPAPPHPFLVRAQVFVFTSAGHISRTGQICDFFQRSGVRISSESDQIRIADIYREFRGADIYGEVRFADIYRELRVAGNYGEVRFGDIYSADIYG